MLKVLIISVHNNKYFTCVYLTNYFTRGVKSWLNNFFADTVDFINFPVFNVQVKIKPNFTNTLTFFYISCCWDYFNVDKWHWTKVKLASMQTRCVVDLGGQLREREWEAVWSEISMWTRLCYIVHQQVLEAVLLIVVNCLYCQIFIVQYKNFT